MATVSRLRPIKRSCPICGNPSTRESFPFCSEGCRNRDLHRWLSGSYAIPVVEDDSSTDDSGDDDR